MTEINELIADEAERTRIIKRIRRPEGQIRGPQTIDELGKADEYGLSRAMAAKSALNQVGLHIIGHSMKRCLIDDTAETRDEVIDQAIATFLKYSNCVK